LAVRTLKKEGIGGKNMVNVAIICEYNPFHNGHKIQIDYIKSKIEDARIIALMSGNFVQRGAPACIQKYKRAEFAVKSGVDLVLELPYPFSCSGAEEYAYCAVKYLDSLSDIDYLCFGSECGDIDLLYQAAKLLITPEFNEKLRERATSDYMIPYAFARSELFSETFGFRLPDRPNDILAVEYVKSILLLGSSIRPLVIKREENFSASAARKAFASKDALSEMLPLCELAYLSENPPVVFEDTADYAIPYLMNSEPETLASYRGVSFDLASKLIKEARSSESISDLESSVSDKRYTRARVRRAIISCVLQDRSEGGPMFSLLLAASDAGRAYIPSDAAQSKRLYTKRSEIKDDGVLASYDRNMKANNFYEYILRKKRIKTVKKPFFISKI